MSADRSADRALQNACGQADGCGRAFSNFKTSLNDTRVKIAHLRTGANARLSAYPSAIRHQCLCGLQPFADKRTGVFLKHLQQPKGSSVGGYFIAYPLIGKMPVRPVRTRPHPNNGIFTNMTTNNQNHKIMKNQIPEIVYIPNYSRGDRPGEFKLDAYENVGVNAPDALLATADDQMAIKTLAMVPGPKYAPFSWMPRLLIAGKPVPAETERDLNDPKWYSGVGLDRHFSGSYRITDYERQKNRWYVRRRNLDPKQESEI